MRTNAVSSRRQHTRELLIHAAATLFAEKSIEGASVEEICERAGFTRGAFYSNFEGKEDLCLAIARHRGEHMLAATRRALAMVPDAPFTSGSFDEIIAGVLAVLDVGIAIDDEWVLVGEELRLYAYRHPSFRPALVAAEHVSADLVVQVLAEALDSHGAHLLIPIDQFLLTVEAYCERSWLETILTGRSDEARDWHAGMDKLVRALIVLPAD